MTSVHETQQPIFTRMDESTRDEWMNIATVTTQNQPRVAQGILEMLRTLSTITDGFAVDQLTHCLQTAARAEAAGADEEVIVAALLHDVDDRKYCPDTCTTYAHAARIMEAAGAPAVVTAEALYMISLVSCSANGNTVPATVADRPELLYPRWADRLEAVGDRGVMRCVQYSYKARTPIALESTPRPDSDAGILAAATAERFAAYQAGAPSASIVDHFYDKLIHVALTPPWLVRNAYLEKEAAGRAEPILAACRAYSAGGQDAAGQYFEQLAAKMGERLDE